MKTIMKVLIASAFTVAIAYGASSNEAKVENSISLSNVESLSYSELGCINRPHLNDGHCVTDGTYFFCANVYPAYVMDCVKAANAQ